MSDNTTQVAAKLDRAAKLIHMADGITLRKQKDRYYTLALDLMKGMPEESERKDEQLADVRFKRNKNKADLIIEAYQRADRLRNQAKTAIEYMAAAEAFDDIVALMKKHNVEEPKLPEETVELWRSVPDPSCEAEKCRAEAARVHRRSRLVKFVKWIAAIGLICFLLIAGSTSTFHIYYGQFLLSQKKYDQAITCFEKAKERHNSEKTRTLYVDGLYEKGCYELTEGNLQEAVTALQEPAKQTYKDAQSLLTEAEIKLLSTKEAGEQSRYGNCDWLILDKDADRICLIKVAGFTAGSFGSGAADEDTWENSSLREYLNTEFLETAFTESEQTHILITSVEAENSDKYGTDGGNNTEDRVYILSNSEFIKYEQLINKTAHCYWLRTPGAYAGTMSFVDVEKILMDFGYDMQSEAMSVRPVIWVSLE